jgi:hypothetical protein
MKQRFFSMPPHERTAFLDEKQNHFLAALARELDLLDPALKWSAPCFQPPKGLGRGNPKVRSQSEL